MAYTARSADRANIYTTVTAKILADLEAGIAPWERPWKDGGAAISLPCNAVTGRPYSGVNILILWGAMRDHSFATSQWATFKQISDVGGRVLKGSKGTAIVYASTFVSADERARAARDGDDARATPFLKSFCVFNLDQCENVEGLRRVPAAPADRDDFADAMVMLAPVEVRTGGDRAFYSPSHDFVQMPALSGFADPLDYGRTLAHEVIHSTGHASRLDRTFGKRFADEFYAREELCAELGAAFVCAAFGVEATTRHADYLGHWIKVLREDNRAIFRAASAASKAAEWLFSNAPDETPDDDGSDDDSDAPTLFPIDDVTPAAPIVEPVATVDDVEPVSTDYYAGGRRVVQGGVPCRVNRYRPSLETVELKEHIRATLAGEYGWDDTYAPGLFRFDPPTARPKGKAKTRAPLAIKMSEEARDYYKGGNRVVIGGVPCRIAGGKPSANRMAMLRECKAFAPVSDKLGWGEPFGKHGDQRFSEARCRKLYEAAMKETRAATAAREKEAA